MYKIPASTLFLGKNLIFMPECHSTNDQMLLLCQNEAPAEGTLIITANQTAGRGQRGNVWEAEPGKNLTFSFLLKPGFLAVQEQFYLNIFVSLAIYDYLTRFTSTKVQIKWPNDLLVNEKKIGGILIENQLAGQRFLNVIVGIGLNINQQRFGIDTATSVSRVTGEEQDLPSVLHDLLGCLESRYLQLREGQYAKLRETYLSLLFRKDELQEFKAGGNKFRGVIRGIDSIGRLLIEKDNALVSFDIREIRYEGL